MLPTYAASSQRALASGSGSSLGCAALLRHSASAGSCMRGETPVMGVSDPRTLQGRTSNRRDNTLGVLARVWFAFVSKMSISTYTCHTTFSMGCLYTHTHTYIYVCVYMCILYIHIYVCVYVYTLYTYICIHTYTYIHVYMYI